MNNFLKAIVVLYFCLYLILGYCWGIRSMEDDAVEFGMAYYHQKTKAFTWGQP